MGIPDGHFHLEGLKELEDVKKYQGGVLFNSLSGKGSLTIPPTHRRFVSVHSINSCVSENCKDVKHEWDTEQTDWDLQHISITSISGPKTT